MTDTERSIEKLNEYLRGEISAVETYNQALRRLTDSPNRLQLEDCKESHELRVVVLRQRILQEGGHPADSSGMWGTFAKLIEGGARAFGEKAAIAALEEGEDHGLKLYRDDMRKLGVAARRFVESDLLPAQEATHRSLSDLKHRLH